MFLLDTDAVSELEKPTPNPGVQAWFETVDWLDLHLSIISVAELWTGIARLPHGLKRRRLETMFDLIPDRFHGRIISVDYSVAIKFGELQASLELPTLDTFIAATALVKRLTLVTRNTRHMTPTGVNLLTPWT